MAYGDADFERRRAANADPAGAKTWRCTCGHAATRHACVCDSTPSAPRAYYFGRCEDCLYWRFLSEYDAAELSPAQVST